MQYFALFFGAVSWVRIFYRRGRFDITRVAVLFSRMAIWTEGESATKLPVVML